MVTTARLQKLKLRRAESQLQGAATLMIDAHAEKASLKNTCSWYATAGCKVIESLNGSCRLSLLRPVALWDGPEVLDHLEVIVIIARSQQMSDVTHVKGLC